MLSLHNILPNQSIEATLLNSTSMIKDNRGSPINALEGNRPILLNIASTQQLNQVHTQPDDRDFFDADLSKRASKAELEASVLVGTQSVAGYLPLGKTLQTFNNQDGANHFRELNVIQRNKWRREQQA